LASNNDHYLWDLLQATGLSKMSLTLADRSETGTTSFLLALSTAISERRHLSQDEVARRIGASRTYISEIETCHRHAK